MVASLYAFAFLLFIFANVSIVQCSNALPSRGANIGRKGAKRNRLIIVPAKKEPVSTKVYRGLSYFREKLQHSGKVAIDSFTRLSRDTTVYFSSDFEVLLLDMTAPTDAMTREEDMDRFLSTTRGFVRNDDTKSQSNTYRVTLRKLWAKIVERDSRTTLKALYILHTLLRMSHPKDSKIYQKLLLTMSREFSRKSNSKYFLKQLPARHSMLATLVEAGNANDDQFVSHFYPYVIARAKLFTSLFEELKQIGFKSDVRAAVKMMNQAGGLLALGLRCYVSAEQATEITAHCMESVAADLRDLIALYGEKAKFLLQEYAIGDLFEGWDDKEALAALKTLRNFYLTRYPQVVSYIQETRDTVEAYKTPTLEDLPSTPVQLPDIRDPSTTPQSDKRP